jgi:uncharacterized protein (DUF2252 family)
MDPEPTIDPHTGAPVGQLSVAERREIGRAARKATPRSSHGDWAPSPARPDPVALIEEQNATRVPWLVPVRHARMRVSPFTFFRGSAKIMASDLAGTPTSGLWAQLGGDAHLSNFGAYASPERNLVFDQNDFDETLPGPWEWDLKRLATSFVVACQFHGLAASAARDAAMTTVRAYREAITGFAAQGHLALWYDVIDADDIRIASHMPTEELQKRLRRFYERATRKTSQHALEKLAEVVDGKWRIRSQPPVLFPLDELPGGQGEEIRHIAERSFENYKETLDDARHALLDRYAVVDIGMKVVGVGSVGTRCLIVLCRGRDENDPLFIQVKEAGPSVLEEHLAPTRYPNEGQRVVEGQRLVQAQSDIFLGWTSGLLAERRDYYVRQLRDWKGSVEVEAEGITTEQLNFYAALCGMTLAKGHARSGDAEAISAYAGGGTALDRSIAAFAESYAAQNLLDYQRFQDAIAEGRLECATEG